MREVYVESNIKGYHKFKIKPELNVEMSVEEDKREPLRLNAVSTQWLFNFQWMTEIGRALANLFKVFKSLLDDQVFVKDIKCFAY